MLLGTTQPLPAQGRLPIESRPLAGAVRRPSYHPTRFALANRVLDMVDEVTDGKADWFQRLFTYLLVGGFAAVVNLVMFHVLLTYTATSMNASLHYLSANVVASEISILANFIPNDRLTFSHLPGHSRSWWARCGRFHLTAIAGTIVTIVISFVLHSLGLLPLLAQAIAIIIALAFNFTFHHLFTYRHK
jgi:putative flippase GtrA